MENENSIASDLQKAFDEAEENQPKEQAPEKEVVTEPVKEEITKDVVEEKEEPSKDEPSEDKEEDNSPIPMPISLNKEEKEHFSKLPREMQAYIVRRESERDRGFSKKSEEFSKTSRRLEAITKSFDPYRSVMQQHGLTEEHLLNNLLSAQAMLERNPMDGLRHIAKSYGINLDLPMQEQQASPSGYVPPEIAQKLAYLENELLQQKQADFSIKASSVQRSIDSFASDSDKSGSLAHPYFNDVQDEMVSFASNIRSANPEKSDYEVLEEAYDKAVWANPNTRQALLEATAIKDRQIKQSAAIQKSKTAKLAGSSIRSNSASSRSGEGKDLKSVRDYLEDAMTTHATN